MNDLRFCRVHYPFLAPLKNPLKEVYHMGSYSPLTVLTTNSNLRPPVPKTGALPLVGLAGLEPATATRFYSGNSNHNCCQIRAQLHLTVNQFVVGSVVKTAALLSSQQIRPPVPKNGVPVRVRPWVPNLRQKRYECSAPTDLLTVRCGCA